MTLELRSLCCTRGSFTLGPVDAVAHRGRLVAILGGNGSGKSTLLLAIACVIRAGGAIRWMGEDLAAMSARGRAARLALVPQRPSLDAPFSVRESVELGRFALPRDPGRVTSAIDSCELGAVESRPWNHCSEGQRQRASLARALAQHAPGGLLILDEPFAAMDPRHARAALALVRACCSAGAVALMATHDLVQAAAADDAWILHDGKLAASGPVARVLTPAVLEPIFEIPFTMIPGVAPNPAPVAAWR